MRSLIARLVLFLCKRFDIWPIDEARRDMGDEAQQRSLRWEAYAVEKGGLFDMLDVIRGEYLSAMGRLEPGQHKKIEALAIGAATVERLRSEVRSVIATGVIEAEQDDYESKIATLPLRKSI